MFFFYANGDGPFWHTFNTRKINARKEKDCERYRGNSKVFSQHDLYFIKKHINAR